MNIDAEQIGTWIGILGALGGVAMTFATMEEKVAQLEGSMAELYNVEEIRTMEKRLTTLEVTQNNSDVGRLSSKIATMQGETNNAKEIIERLEKNISDLQSEDTSALDSGVEVNKSRISTIQGQIRSLNSKIEKLVYKLENSNPLG